MAINLSTGLPRQARTPSYGYGFYTPPAPKKQAGLAAGAAPVTQDASQVPQQLQPIDYNAMIQTNPYFRQAQDMYGNPNQPGNIGSLGTQNLSDLSNAFRSAVIRFGQVPTGLTGATNSYLNQFITPDVANLAAQNQFSTTALEDRAHAITARDTLNQLGARGMAGSSERPYLLGTTGGYGTAGGQVGFQYAQQRNQDIDQLNAMLAGAQQSYVSAENQRMQNYLNALYNAVNNQAQFTQQVGGANQQTTPNVPVTPNYGFTQQNRAPATAVRRAANRGALRSLAGLGRLF